jgi:hypothetical protein
MTLFADPAYPEVAIMFALLVLLPLALREADRARVRLVQRHRHRAASDKSRRD